MSLQRCNCLITYWSWDVTWVVGRWFICCHCGSSQRMLHYLLIDILCSWTAAARNKHCFTRPSHLFVCVSHCLSVCLSVSLTACLSVSLCLSLPVCLSLCVSHCLSVCLSVSLTACLSVSHCQWVYIFLQGDHLSRVAGNVGEFGSCRWNILSGTVVCWTGSVGRVAGTSVAGGTSHVLSCVTQLNVILLLIQSLWTVMQWCW